MIVVKICRNYFHFLAAQRSLASEEPLLLSIFSVFRFPFSLSRRHEFSAPGAPRELRFVLSELCWGLVDPVSTTFPKFIAVRLQSTILFPIRTFYGKSKVHTIFTEIGAG